jgi:hypothetical protein
MFLCRQSIISAITAPCLEVELWFVQILTKKFMEHALQESPENLGLRKLFRNLGEKIDSTTLGTGFYNVRPDQNEGSATSHHGTALSNSSNVVTTELSRGARAWAMSITLRIRSTSPIPPPRSVLRTA